MTGGPRVHDIGVVTKTLVTPSTTKRENRRYNGSRRTGGGGNTVPSDLVERIPEGNVDKEGKGRDTSRRFFDREE